MLLLALVAALLIAGDRNYHQRRMDAGGVVFQNMTDARMEALLLDESRERATVGFETMLLWVVPLAILALYGVWELATALRPDRTDGRRQ